MAKSKNVTIAAGKLAGKTVAFVGKFGYGDSQRTRYQQYTEREGGAVVDVESAAPDYLVVGEGRGGQPPAVVAKVLKKHPGVQALDLADFCRLLMPSRDELLADLRAGPHEDRHKYWDRLADLFRQAGSLIDLTGADLRKTDLLGANLTIATLDGADLRGASAHYAHFGDLRNVRCDGADLSHINFANAADCRFGKATMTKAWFLDSHTIRPLRFERCEFSGAKLQQIRGRQCQVAGCTFTGADLSDAQIEEADFSRANLERADLSRVHGRAGKFDGANFARAVLFRADLRDASLVNADLHDADLREAVLTGADLTGAQIDGADFAGAELTGAKIAGLDLSRARNYQPPVVRQPGPKLYELAKVAAGATKRFVTCAEVDLGKGEHALLQLCAAAGNNRVWINARSVYRRKDNEAYDRIDAPTFEQGMFNLAARWPGATLRLDTITAKGSRSPRGRQLLDLATAAWAEAFGMESASADDLQRQKAKQQAAAQKLREAMLKELKGGLSGVKKWNARSEREHRHIGALRDLDLKGANLAGVVIRQHDLRGCDFQGASLENAELWNSQLQNTNIAGANLEGAKLDFSHFESASFRGARLVRCKTNVTYFNQADFTGADLTGSNFRFASLLGADFTGANLAGVDFRGARYDAATKFPAGFTPPQTMQWQGPPPGAAAPPPPPKSGSLDFHAFLKLLNNKVEQARMQKAGAMLKAERFQLFAEVKDDSLVGVVKSQSSSELVYSCRLTKEGAFGCCTQNLRPCGGLRGALCKHLLVLIVGLAKAGRLDPATVDHWVDLSRSRKPAIDEDVMSATFLRYKGAEAGEVDWRPTETIPEDFYAM